MDNLEAKREELLEKFMPGLWQLSKELGIDIQVAMVLVALHEQARWCQELSKMQADYKKVEIAFEEYKKRVMERIGEEEEAKIFRAALDE